MNGGPSQLDMWDYKPGLKAQFDKDLPDSIRNGETSIQAFAHCPWLTSLLAYFTASSIGQGI